MNEKYVEALEQYEMDVISVRKGRGLWICETKNGCRLLKEYRGMVKHLEFEDEILRILDTRGSLRANRYIRSKEGSLLTMTGDGTRYILRDWLMDRECNIKGGFEIRQALSRLAMLRGQLRTVEFKEGWGMGSILFEFLEEKLKRHNREVQRTRNYIHGKRKRSEFELCVIGNYNMFCEQALGAVQEIKGLWTENVVGFEYDALEATEVKSPRGPKGAMQTAVPSDRTGEKPAFPCHGNLDQHHVLMGPNYTAITEYSRMHLGIQALDLYRFMCEAMEKHGWNVDLGSSILDSYERILPMDRQELTCLYCLFLYPEKYWKQLSFHYNANRAWILGRNIDKLHGLEEQQQQRNHSLKHLQAGCGV